ncbi:MAG: hypothetical protein COW73_11575 [Nitrospirae bacterium CG18_big_fil_WC_8_21_14_2_50_70_55]|nr:hypothetical protein [Deltaproteobacteria bacterium]OIP66112.1 MAG: hypothetical protein AUK30_03130 [Nitrospirae bacterium CG2_30_70_394]PIQ03255.1 MAG: hypothetical protein COW73_11575 [Nitrospirae bacterium CG18_big_fil_WC_8_21_14_2_50_70_55]PIU77495.1 MAG: hypothetical protein COS73_10290 [Nitrospirae bacterium CG06_land_8_20_14_3_00_70_43]PIW83061.1 MAG: hypothetical protein COZ96_05370 [Nitrospirae bacterium CG_4_8_14_3_um_filter_70_85]PIX82729.1 MAG: hypothetical protein COZ33_09180 
MIDSENDPEQARAAARARAVRLLAPAPLTARQLGERLARRGFAPAVVAAVVAECIAHGWVDDGEYARRWCERRRAQGYGRAWIQQELRQRGIAAPLAVAAFAAEEGGAELAAARQAAARKVRSLGGLAGEGDRAKLARFLAARGFDGATVRRVVEESDEPPDPEPSAVPSASHGG